MKKSSVFTVLRIAVSLGLLAVMAEFADWNSILSSLSHFKIGLIPAVFGCIALSIFLSTLKWAVLLNGNKLNQLIAPLFRIYLTALFFNNFLPSSIGGDGIRIYSAGKLSGKTSAAAASVVVDRVLATVSLALLGLVSAVFATKPAATAVIMLAGLFAVGVSIAAILLTGWVPRFIKRKDGKISSAWKSFAESAGGLRKKPSALFNSFLLSIAFQIVVALVVASVMLGLGLPVPGAADLFFITSASSVLAMVPLGLNGYGLREGAYIFLLQPFGYSVSSALTVSILFAVFVSIFSLAGGINWILSKTSYNSTTKEGVTI